MVFFLLGFMRKKSTFDIPYDFKQHVVFFVFLTVENNERKKYVIVYGIIQIFVFSINPDLNALTWNADIRSDE